MATWLRGLSDALPLTYAYDALARVAQTEVYDGRFVLDVAVTVVATLLALGLGAATLRRRTA
jgi:ABC-2 type transport system permease protein